MFSHLSDIVRAISEQEYLFSLHIWENFVAEDNRPPPSSIISSIRNDKPEVLENYPDDTRGPCCLIISVNSEGRDIHSVVTYGMKPIKIVTAYYPSNDEWINNRKRRKI